jgi:hypothetical protein
MSKSRLGLLTLLAFVVPVAVVSAVLLVPRDRERTNGNNGPITDPIPAETIVSGLALTLTEFVTMPRSDPPATDDPRVQQRWARINFLGAVPDRSGRLFVPDLNGQMYLIEDGKPREYLNVGAEFVPNFWTTSGLGSGFGFVPSILASRRTAGSIRSTPRHGTHLRQRRHTCRRKIWKVTGAPRVR